MTITAKTRSVTAPVPSELAERIDRVANRLTRKALADVDAGRVFDHQSVQTWAESLGTESPLPLPH
ncbi:CopG family transcriptional regulator [Pseudomonas xanthosomatis]|uniref:CopG family transcriptional regulator n=1 Tax=Pseudomonas xanthosomatis TaxID=2842356 RepID=UPI0035168225